MNAKNGWLDKQLNITLDKDNCVIIDNDVCLIIMHIQQIVWRHIKWCIRKQHIAIRIREEWSIIHLLKLFKSTIILLQVPDHIQGWTWLVLGVQLSGIVLWVNIILCFISNRFLQNKDAEQNFTSLFLMENETNKFICDRHEILCWSASKRPFHR